MVHASLFSGIGGPEVAAAMMGWENAFHCEINPFGRAVLEYWFPESKSYEDITKTNFCEWRGRIDVLTGGFPCQPFSYAGKRGGAYDTRYLWPEMLRAIDEIRPTWVVGENVAGITTMVEGGVLSPLGNEGTLFGEVDGVHRFGLRETFTIERICRDLEGLGYSVQPMLIPAAAVGAPHRRDRVFILAYDDNADRRDDEGRAGEDERESARQRLCKRHEIRVAGVAGDVRPEIQRPASDSASDGRHGDTREDGKERCAGADGERPAEESADGFGLRGIAGLYGEQLAAAHADRKGREEPKQPGRGENSEEERAGVDDRVERPRRDENPAASFRKRLETALQRRSDGTKGRDGKGRYALKFTDDAWLEGTWWSDFPTVSPVHSGNDGLPFGMDGTSIPFTKWRTEALKAYGNAIVPQVMYRIFQAIDEVEIEG